MIKREIEQTISEILSKKRKCSNLSHIFEIMKDEKHIISGILSLEKLFNELLNRGEFQVDETLMLANKKEYDREIEYIRELNKQYETTMKKLFEFMNNTSKEVQTEALASILRLSGIEAKFSGSERKDTYVHLTRRLQEVTRIIILSGNSSCLLVRFQEFLEFKDVHFYTWKALRAILPGMTEDGDQFVTNVLNLLEKLCLPKTTADSVRIEVDASELLCQPTGSNHLVLEMTQAQKWVSQVWKCLIKKTVSPRVHRHLLLVLVESYLSAIQKPIFLTDFLMDSMNVGGPNCLLAMQGMSVLMQKHNIEYPNVYGKLYNMFEPDILNSKYRSRLFYLADIFLSSTYLPEQLVAAFIKRIARLALKCQVAEIVLSLRFIGNLLLRHPGLRKMIHHPVGGEVAEDPYDMTETDPLKSRANESSLWEVSLLKRHAQPKVASAASFIDGNLPQMEWDLTPLLDSTSQLIFEVEMKKKFKDTTVTFFRPQSIAQLNEDRLYKLWSLT